MRYTLPILIFILAACQSASTQKHATQEIEAQEKLRLEIMAVHDAVMPEMGPINRLSRNLKPLLKEEGRLDENEKEILLDVLKQLHQSGEGMMSWMAEFDNNLDGMRDTLDHEAIMQYLRAEEEKIRKVDADMRASLKAGKALAEKYQLDK